jgi:actin
MQDYVDYAMVIDNGTFTMKAGFSGDDAPRAFFPTVVGRLKSPKLQPPASFPKDVYVGDEALHKQRILDLRNPIERGTIVNWDDFERVWSHTFFNEMSIDPTEHCFMMTEQPLNSNKCREKSAEILFETFQVMV